MRRFDRDFAARLNGSGLTTAEVLYRLPDHPVLVQTFVWQTLDIAPDFPRVRSFIDHWIETIEAPIDCVRVAHSALVRPAEWRKVDGEFRLH